MSKRFQSKLLRASDPDQVKSIVDYVRMNISRLSSVFIRPLGYQDVEQELQEEFGFSPEVAELICPVVNQRVDKTLNDSQFKRALEVSLNSAPAQTLLKSSSFKLRPQICEGFVSSDADSDSSQRSGGSDLHEATEEAPYPRRH